MRIKKLKSEIELLEDVEKLQDDYQTLIDEHRLNEKSMFDLVCPFRDKYKLTDLQALMVARSKMSISEIFNLLCKEG